jgi:hypothetical protein
LIVGVFGTEIAVLLCVDDDLTEHRALREELAALQAEHDRLSSAPSSGAEYRVYSDRLDAFHARLAVHLEHLQRRS